MNYGNYDLDKILDLSPAQLRVMCTLIVKRERYLLATYSVAMRAAQVLKGNTFNTWVHYLVTSRKVDKIPQGKVYPGFKMSQQENKGK